VCCSCQKVSGATGKLAIYLDTKDRKTEQHQLYVELLGTLLDHFGGTMPPHLVASRAVGCPALPAQPVAMPPWPALVDAGGGGSGSTRPRPTSKFNPKQSVDITQELLRALAVKWSKGAVTDRDHPVPNTGASFPPRGAKRGTGKRQREQAAHLAPSVDHHAADDSEGTLPYVSAGELEAVKTSKSQRTGSPVGDSDDEELSGSYEVDDDDGDDWDHLELASLGESEEEDEEGVEDDDDEEDEEEDEEDDDEDDDEEEEEEDEEEDEEEEEENGDPHHDDSAVQVG
jgi:hypothetical protein